MRSPARKACGALQLDFSSIIKYNIFIESDALQVSFAKPRQNRKVAAVCGTNCDWDYLALFVRTDQG